MYFRGHSPSALKLSAICSDLPRMDKCVPGRLFHHDVGGSSEVKEGPAVYILNLVNITNDRISETGIFRGTRIDPCKKGSKFSAPKTDAGEFAASQTAHIGQEADFDLHVRGAVSGT